MKRRKRRARHAGRRDAFHLTMIAVLMTVLCLMIVNIKEPEQTEEESSRRRHMRKWYRIRKQSCRQQRRQKANTRFSMVCPRTGGAMTLRDSCFISYRNSMRIKAMRCTKALSSRYMMRLQCSRTTGNTS